MTVADLFHIQTLQRLFRRKRLRVSFRRRNKKVDGSSDPESVDALAGERMAVSTHESPVVEASPDRGILAIMWLRLSILVWLPSTLLWLRLLWAPRRPRPDLQLHELATVQRRRTLVNDVTSGKDEAKEVEEEKDDKESKGGDEHD